MGKRTEIVSCCQEYPHSRHTLKTVNTGSTNFFGRYKRIASTNSPTFCMKTVSASLTKLTALLPQTRDCSCYISRRMLAPSLLRLYKHNDLLSIKSFSQHTFICLIIISGYMFRPHGPSSGLNFIVTLIQIYVNVTSEISIVLYRYAVLIFCD